MKTFESFESNRWIWRINILLQIILVAVLVAIVNYIGMREYYRTDLTKNRAFSLSPETISYINELNEPVKVIVTLTDSNDSKEISQAFRDVRGVLREFAYYSRDNPRGPISVEFVNVFEQRMRAELLGVEEKPDVVVFRAGDREHTVFLNELYQTLDRQTNQFAGEKRFTAALLDVANRVRPIIYFLQGHGEMRLDDVNRLRGASQLEAALSERNYETSTLDLAVTRAVPADAAAVVVLSPQTPILPTEQQALRTYLSAGAGRVILALDPGQNHGLDDLLFEWGVLADDVLVVEKDPSFQLAGGDILIRRPAQHPITQVLYDNKIPVLMGLARSVRADPGRPIDESLVVTDVLATSNTSWGETSYRINSNYEFDPVSDLRGPLIVGVVSERKVDSNLAVNLPGGRLIVFGSSDFLANHRIDAAGNLTLILNSLSWAIDRDKKLNIPTRPIERLKLTLSQEQLVMTSITIVAGPALLIAMIGIIVHLMRRR
jgi:ABC-type uncharacterized transport system involved in gliding motility auxiliary subunit